MNSKPGAVSRQGLDAAFEAEETRKSNLLLEAQRLLAEQQIDEAAARFAAAAAIEGRLGEACEAKGLTDKAHVHRFSELTCWAHAGNVHDAILLGEALLARPDLPARLRQRVLDYTQALRARRARWSAEPVLLPAGAPQ